MTKTPVIQHLNRNLLNLNRKEFVVIALVLSSGIAQAASSPTNRMPITSIRPLLQEAAQTGAAYGVMVGRQIDALSAMYKTKSPIEVDAIAIRDLPKPGCKRLKVSTIQRNTVNPTNGKVGDSTYVYEVSYCADGTYGSEEAR